MIARDAGGERRPGALALRTALGRGHARGVDRHPGGDARALRRPLDAAHAGARSTARSRGGASATSRSSTAPRHRSLGRSGSAADRAARRASSGSSSSARASSACASASRELSLDAGDVMLWDGLMPVEIEVIEPFVKRTVIFPRERAARRLPAARGRAGAAAARPAARRCGCWSATSTRSALELAATRRAGRVVAADAALELLRAAVAPSVPSSRSARRAAMCAEVRRYIRSHLQDAAARPRVDRRARTRCRCARCTRCSRTATSRSAG